MRPPRCVHHKTVRSVRRACTVSRRIQAKSKPESRTGNTAFGGHVSPRGLFSERRERRLDVPSLIDVVTIVAIRQPLNDGRFYGELIFLYFQNGVMRAFTLELRLQLPTLKRIYLRDRVPIDECVTSTFKNVPTFQCYGKKRKKISIFRMKLCNYGKRFVLYTFYDASYRRRQTSQLFVIYMTRENAADRLNNKLF